MCKAKIGVSAAPSPRQGNFTEKRAHGMSRNGDRSSRASGTVVSRSWACVLSAQYYHKTHTMGAANISMTTLSLDSQIVHKFHYPQCVSISYLCHLCEQRQCPRYLNVHTLPSGLRESGHPRECHGIDEVRAQVTG